MKPCVTLKPNRLCVGLHLNVLVVSLVCHLGVACGTEGSTRRKLSDVCTKNPDARSCRGSLAPSRPGTTPGPDDSGSSDGQAGYTIIPMSTKNAPDGRRDHSAVLANGKLIIFGGTGAGGSSLASGGMYDTATDSWLGLSMEGQAPESRASHAALWTGTKMLVWGGNKVTIDSSNKPILQPLATGASFDPATSRWSAVSSTNAPPLLESFSWVWAGSKFIVWGGLNTASGTALPTTPFVYDPIRDTWTLGSNTGAPAGRLQAAAVWTGSKMFVWGGKDIKGNLLDDGGLYDPAINSWTPVPASTEGPTARANHSMVWSGKEALVWGGTVQTSIGTQSSCPRDLGIFTPDAAVPWKRVASEASPLGRTMHAAAFLADRFLVWGGVCNVQTAGDTSPAERGGVYSVVTGLWKAFVPSVGALGRQGMSASSDTALSYFWGGGEINGYVSNEGFKATPR